MKKEWVEPRIQVQQFAPNDAVSNCIVGQIECAYPGNGADSDHWVQVDGNWVEGTNGEWVFGDYNGESTGWYYEDEKHPHGLCANKADIAFNGTTASGYEWVDGAADHNRPIYDIELWDPTTGISSPMDWNMAEAKTYNVAWKSYDTPNKSEYHHIGHLIVSWIDQLRHNHS